MKKKKSSVKRTKVNLVPPSQQAATEEIRRLQAGHTAAIKKSQLECPHLQGCHPSGDCGFWKLTSIVWHTFDTGNTNGLCTNCGRVFTARDRDYVFWRSVPSGNQLSSAGVLSEGQIYPNRDFKKGEKPTPEEIGTVELFIDDYRLKDGTFLSTHTLPNFLQKNSYAVADWLVKQYPRFIRDLVVVANGMIAPDLSSCTVVY